MIPHCEAIIPKIMLKNNGLLKEKAEKQYATASAFCYSNHNSLFHKKIGRDFE